MAVDESSSADEAGTLTDAYTLIAPRNGM